jgi:hypothetical protein
MFVTSRVCQHLTIAAHSPRPQLLAARSCKRGCAHEVTLSVRKFPRKLLRGLLAILLAVPYLFAADNLRLNSHLDYSSDSQDGPLITGDNMQAGVVAGMTNYIVMYGEGCFNSKRQARRTVELYNKYRDRVNFVVVDLDKPQSGAQQELVKRFYRGYIPHVVVLSRHGTALYDSSGEVSSIEIEKIFEKSFRGE